MKNSITLFRFEIPNQMRLYKKVIAVVFVSEGESEYVFSDGTREHYEAGIFLCIRNEIDVAKVKALDHHDKEFLSLPQKIKKVVNKILSGEKVSIGKTEYIKLRTTNDLQNLQKAVGVSSVWVGALEKKYPIEIENEAIVNLISGIAEGKRIYTNLSKKTTEENNALQIN